MKTTEQIIDQFHAACLAKISEIHTAAAVEISRLEDERDHVRLEAETLRGELAERDEKIRQLLALVAGSRANDAPAILDDGAERPRRCGDKRCRKGRPHCKRCRPAACTCEAYHYPHRKGSGQCGDTDALNLRAWGPSPEQAAADAAYAAARGEASL